MLPIRGVNVPGTHFLFFYFVQRAERAHVTMCLKSRIIDLPQKTASGDRNQRSRNRPRKTRNPSSTPDVTL